MKLPYQIKYTNKDSKKIVLQRHEIEFFLDKRCFVYPHCDLIKDPESCLHVLSTNYSCSNCSYKVNDPIKKKALFLTHNRYMEKRVNEHYSFIRGNRWKKEVRKRILEYDESKCIICGIDIKKRANVHHILRFSGDADISIRNLVTLCSDCHVKLEPVYPFGMIKLGWPHMDLFTTRLKEFYKEIQKASFNNRGRLILPIEHHMDHLCFICDEHKDCKFGNIVIDNNRKLMRAARARNKL